MLVIFIENTVVLYGNPVGINWNYGNTTLDSYKKLMGAYNNNEEFKLGILNNFSSSDMVCINREINGNNAWCIVNTRNANSSFNLPLELQNFSGTNLLDGTGFSTNGNVLSLNPFEILIFK